MLSYGEVGRGGDVEAGERIASLCKVVCGGGVCDVFGDVRGDCFLCGVI